jgi:hypothetical protein
MNKDRCLYCNSPLGERRHGNQDYCDEDCNYEMRLVRNRANYQQQKALREAFQKSDKILEMFFAAYGPDQYIPAALLDNAGMEWLISKGEVILDQLPIKIIGQYGYILFIQEKIKIWKIPA